MATPDPTVTPPKEPDRKSVGELVFDVSEKTSSLIREEIGPDRALMMDAIRMCPSASGITGPRMLA